MPKKLYISPSPKVYSPVALEREIVVNSQVKYDEQTIVWGQLDDLPLRIMNAVNKSPTTTSCLGVQETFITGSGFTDGGLMDHVIDKDGTTLWDFHTQIVPYLTLLEAFSINFQFDLQGKITNSYVLGSESCRFVRPPGKSKKIDFIKFNPYFGTHESNQDYTSTFPVFDLAGVKKQVKGADEKYQGQIFFYGTVRPPYKFYPVPKYWSGEEWIYVDAGIKTFHKKNQENGFFQSALINVIGDPNQMSKNPKYMTEVTLANGQKRKVNNTVTVAQELDEQMSEMFSGVRKAGTGLVMWSLNKDQAIQVQAFPVNSQFDILSGTFTDAIKGICIATEVDPILLTLQGSGLVNSGDSLRAVVENQQSKAAKKQRVLENFYNTTMLPNLQNKVKQEVKIKNYSPVSLSVTVEDKFWNVLSEVEKKTFVKENIPGMGEIIQDEIIDEATGEPITPQETELSEAISKMKTIDVIRLRSIATKFDKGELNLEQAKMLLKGKGLTESQANTWLGVVEEPKPETP